MTALRERLARYFYRREYAGLCKAYRAKVDSQLAEILASAYPELYIASLHKRSLECQ